MHGRKLNEINFKKYKNNLLASNSFLCFFFHFFFLFYLPQHSLREINILHFEIKLYLLIIIFLLFLVGSIKGDR